MDKLTINARDFYKNLTQQAKKAEQEMKQDFLLCNQQQRKK